MSATLNENGVLSDTAGGVALGITRQVTPRAYISYNASSGGIQRSYGVSSITVTTTESGSSRNAVRIFFSAALPDSDGYVALLTGGYVDRNSNTHGTAVAGRTTTSCYAYQTFMSFNSTAPSRMSFCLFA